MNEQTNETNEIEALEERSLTKYGRIMVYSGTLVDPLALEPEDVVLADIIRGLCFTYRYRGHADPNITVAEHSIIVADILDDPEWALYGLLHDSCEAYLGDISAPVMKSLHIHRGEAIWGFQEAERRIKVAVARRFDLDPLRFQDPELLKADLIARDIERTFMRNMQWNEPVVPEEHQNIRPQFYSSEEVLPIFTKALANAGLKG